MSGKIYISRKSAEELQAALTSALNDPENSATLFQIWGVGGVGKTTLTEKLIRECGKLADFAAESFNFISMGLDVEISDPISLMNRFYQQLEPKFWQKDLLRRKDPFLSLYKQYYQTIHHLESQPLPNQPKVTESQKNLVVGLLKNGAKVATLFNVPGATVVEQNSDRIAKGATMVLDEADRWREFVAQHRATKKKQDLQALMLKPLPKLTEAFVMGLQGRKRPIVLVLDTYEQAPPEIETWLLYLLSRTNLTQTNIKLLIAGRRNLLDREPWRKLQQDKKAVYDRALFCFDEKQIAAYLQDIGITESADVETIVRATKGLPYYLDKIRDCVEKGKTLDFSAIDRDIERLLLEGFGNCEKLVAQLAACCRWFNKSLLNYLLQDFPSFQEEPKEREKKRDWFDWLSRRGFVKYARNRWSLDDVARDIFRESFYLEDRDRFEQVNSHLADYFQQQADREVSPDRHPVEKYKNSAWRDNSSEFIYYLLHTDRDSDRVQFFSYLFESRYLKRDDVMQTPISTILAECNLERRLCVKESQRNFLEQIRPLILAGRWTLGQDKIDYAFLKSDLNLSQKQIDNSLRICLQNPELFNALQDLAKYAALFYKSKCCRNGENLTYLKMANEQAKKCYCVTDPEFMSGLFLWDIGNSFHFLEQYEEAIISYNKAIEFKPDSHKAWLGCGAALGELERLEEAISSFDKAIEFGSDYHEAWYNRGIALGKLERLEEAISSFDRAIELKPDWHEVWYNRGVALGNLGKLEEAISSYDKAIEFKPDYHEAWSNRGVTLGNLGKLEEAISSYDKAIEFKPDLHEAWSNRGVALGNLGKLEEAISSYDKAIE
ncbi:MAG: tetratricopeptide repeat protein, partial [Cyanobacteria bacterium P01_E01_bin.42]